MKKAKKIMMILCILLAVCMMPATAGAAKKVTYAKTYSLKDVRKAARTKGRWVKKKKGWRFRKKSGGALKNRWMNVNNKIYYVNAAGYRATGWVKYRGKFYYMAKNGELQTKTWVKDGKKYYYVGANGRRKQSCWLTLDGKKYYLDEDGVRVTGTQYIGEKGYYFKKNGVYDPSVKVKLEVNPKKKMVALTFDDGPGPYTDRLLKCLKKNGGKATFFMVGSNVSKYKKVVKKMADMGCELGNHSYNHLALTTLSNSSIRSEVSRTNAKIRAAAGKDPTLFRLPYGDGHSSSRVLSLLQLPSIYWSIDTRDWANTGNPQSTINAVLNNVKNGDIILMHDIHLSTVQAAEKIIPALKKRGYQLVTVSQLAKYKGKTNLKNGKTYYSFR